MYDFTQGQLQSILELEPGDNAPHFYRQGFADAQRKIYEKLSGEVGIKVSKAVPPQPAAKPSTVVKPAGNPEPVVGMEVRSRTGIPGAKRVISAVYSTSVSVSVPSEGWQSSYGRSDFWKLFDPVDPSAGLVISALELADELTRIDRILENLPEGYSDARRPAQEAWSSKLFEALSKRRSELRQKIVELG